MEFNSHHFQEIDSTNNWAKLNAHLFDKKKITLITADAQTGGRGRFNRKWISPKGENIYATFCFFISKKRIDIGNLPQVMALSALELLNHFNLNAKLKWPNDLLLSGKKVGGILCETIPFDETLMVILGIGLNVNMAKEELHKIDRPATSMKVEAGYFFKLNTVLDGLKNQFAKDLELFLKLGFKPFLLNYRNAISLKMNESITFHDNQKEIEGYFHSINEDGTLKLTLKTGEVKTFVSGEFVG